MVDGGRARMAAMMQRNEDKDSATNNPYASAVFRRFVMPAAAIIDEDMNATGTGKYQGPAKAIKALDATTVAYIAVRHALNALMNDKKLTARRLCHDIGQAVCRELLLAVFENEEPSLFYTVQNDIGRRMSKSERYRIAVFRDQAKKAGIPLPEFGSNGTTQIGAYLVDVLENLGMLATLRERTKQSNGAFRDTVHVTMDEGLLDLIGQVKDFMIAACPLYLPCVEKPLDWKGVADGGWHTNAMKRAQPFAIKTEGAWSELAEYDLSAPLAAINALQGVRWQINRQMLLAIREVARYYDTDEIVGYQEPSKPERPFWLAEDMKAKDMTPEEAAEFRAWRRATAEWFTDKKIRGTKYGRFNTAMSVAERFEAYPELYFVYFADFRGRMYVQSTGVSPQGSDLQKALLRFAEGKPLHADSAKKWFKINGANKYGFDKASLEDRAAWVDKHHDIIMRLAADPVSCKDDWANADSPLQYLAWCLEYKRWQDDPENFKSHLPVGMDGSCNGLQNFSAMLRDEVGGKATNLIPGQLPADIYQMVADRVTEILKALKDNEIPEDDGAEETQKKIRHLNNENRFRALWLSHGLTRGLVKRSVMTKPYGSTRFSCADFIVADYLKEGKAPEFAKEEYAAAARYLSRFVWQAIGDIVVKADEVMDWLQKSSSRALADNDHIRWVTPDGFPVIQYYQKCEYRAIRTRLMGAAKLRVASETDTPDKARHKNGVAPNFVHSNDANHMRMVARAAVAAGIHSFAMIHDDFGTHAADAEQFYGIIRSTFVDMYTLHDPLTDFAERYSLPNPPKAGKLDLRLVLNSPYFFS